MAYRLVGFLEYGKALENLERLVKLLSKDELRAIDTMVAERDEFTVYSNLSRRVQPHPRRLQTSTSTADDFARRGLAWMMALARVELGAMLAGFTSVREPFAIVRPTALDLDAFRELLSDGARTHYWALVRDPSLPAMTRSSPRNSWVLSYSRRLTMARALLRATLNYGTVDSPQESYELSKWKEDLDNLQAGFVAKIQLYLTRRVTTQSRGYIEACTALLAAERRELSNGTATVTHHRTNQ